MFTVLASILFGIIILFALCVPFFALQRMKNHQYFCIIWILLYISQLFMYIPGSDVSPYAYAHFDIQSLKFIGQTLSAWACIVLLLFVVMSTIFRKRIPVQSMLRAFLLSIIPNILVFVWTPSLGSSIDSFAKSMTPFFVMLYFTCCVDEERAVSIKKIIEAINVLMVGQVLLCKLVEGTTSAYNYYYELSEEFFGYYNHPHSFTSLLWILTIYNIYEISRNERKKLNLFLFLFNVACIYFTRVRTYLVALLGALGYIGLQSFFDKRGKRLRGYVVVAFVLLVFFGPQLISNLGGNRIYLSGDSSSGRFLRWGLDLQYMITRYSVPQLLFGRGVDAAFVVNRELFGVYINSLNLIIDLLLDFGIVGSICILVAYYLLFRQGAKGHNRMFTKGLFVSFFLASMINSPVAFVPTMTMLIVLLWVIQVDKEVLNNRSKRTIRLRTVR